MVKVDVDAWKWYEERWNEDASLLVINELNGLSLEVLLSL